MNDKGYGKTSEDLVAQVVKYSSELNIQTILDFGCGKSKTVDLVGKHLNCESFRYDPAIPEWANLPIAKVDLVINTDVLEHLDISEVDLLLDDISTITDNVFFNISTRPAMQSLPNGENAHATVKKKVWWEVKLREYFPHIQSIPSYPDEARFITWKSSIRGTSAERLEMMQYTINWLFKRFRYILKRTFRLV